MPHPPNISATAFLIADPTRVAMLTVLLDGRARPAGELANMSGVTAQTASAHLAKLLDGGLVAVASQGRHRYYRLAGPHVAQALESLAAVRAPGAVRARVLSPQQRQLRFCRTCYDHLAGQVGVALTRALQEQGYIRPAREKQFVVTPSGLAWFARVGVDVSGLKPTGSGIARQCLDWTERIHHLAGPLGVQLARALCSNGWLRRVKDSRVVVVTPVGWMEFGRSLGMTEDMVRRIGEASVDDLDFPGTCPAGVGIGRVPA